MKTAFFYTTGEKYGLIVIMDQNVNESRTRMTTCTSSKPLKSQLLVMFQ